MELQVQTRESELSFRVKVTPRAKSSEIQGVSEGVLLVRLMAPPVEGKANQALREFLAQRLTLRTSQVQIRVGDKSRTKIVAVSGLSLKELEDRLFGQAS